MTEVQSAVTIGAVVLGTMATRFLPFLVFPKGKTPPKFVQYLGKVLPCAAIGLLVVYCFKDAASSGTYGIPEILSMLLIIVLHKWKKNTLLSIGGGTALYMLLVQNGVQIIRCATDIFEDRLCRIHQIPRPPLRGGSFAYPRRRTRTRRKSRPGGLLPCGTE